MLFLTIFILFLVFVFYVCSLPRDYGHPCYPNDTNLHYYLYNESSSIPLTLAMRYRYAHTTNKCERFQYHGCSGNWNNFYTETACATRCGEFLFGVNFKIFLCLHLAPYRETNHNYLDALFTTKLGLGFVTGIIEFFLGAIFYIMCLPFVRKGGYFQVR